tara:strand:+ start:39 stop:203 length:165 start_codon:yes stop_codon:yes gene_type:complete
MVHLHMELVVEVELVVLVVTHLILHNKVVLVVLVDKFLPHSEIPILHLDLMVVD